MIVTMKISRETPDESRDIEVDVLVEVDAYGAFPARHGWTTVGERRIELTEAERDKATELALEESGE